MTSPRDALDSFEYEVTLLISDEAGQALGRVYQGTYAASGSFECWYGESFDAFVDPNAFPVATRLTVVDDVVWSDGPFRLEQSSRGERATDISNCPGSEEFWTEFTRGLPTFHVLGTGTQADGFDTRRLGGFDGSGPEIVAAVHGNFLIDLTSTQTGDAAVFADILDGPEVWPEGPLTLAISLQLRRLNDPTLSVETPGSSIFDGPSEPTVTPWDR